MGDKDQEQKDDDLIARLRQDVKDVHAAELVEDNAPADVDGDEVPEP